MASKPISTPFAALGESFDLMQKMWGLGNLPTPGNLASMARTPQQLPSMLAPTVDVAELDKRIADLRAVEQWLELNANMLRTTIQTLEVQRATIATLKGISGALLAPMIGAPPPPPEPSRVVPTEVRTGIDAPQLEASASPAPKRKRAKPVASDSSPSLAEDALNPAAWWNALQDQFSKIAAASNDGSGEEARRAAPPARKTGRARRKR